ncbi:MAG: ParA family protein [Pseudomonadota bacterium]
MNVVSVFNIKGGVGKTATAVNLGHAAAAAGVRVLVWDLDPQGAASFYFRIKPRIKGGGKELLRGKGKIGDLIKATDFAGLDLLPSDFSYRALDLRLTKEKPTHLRNLLRPLAAEYDLVLIDCPPSMSELSEQVFRASALLLVPMIPTTLSQRTLEQLTAVLADMKKKAPPVRTVMTMVDRRKSLHRQVLEAETASRLNTVVPYASVVERMGVERCPVAAFAPRSRAAAAYRAIWAEIAPSLAAPESVA